MYIYLSEPMTAETSAAADSPEAADFPEAASAAVAAEAGRLKRIDELSEVFSVLALTDPILIG